MLSVLPRHGEHVWARFHRPGVQGNIIFCKTGIGVKRLGLPRHRRKEGHCHPIVELRVFAANGDLQRVLVERLESLAVKLREINARGGVSCLSGLFPCIADRLTEFVETDDIGPQNTESGTDDGRRRNALDAVNIVMRSKLSRTALGQLQGAGERLGAFGIERQAKRFALFILGKRRMRGKLNAFSDRNRVDGVRNVLAVGIFGQDFFIRIKIHGLDNFFGRQRHQRIGAL